MEYRQRQREERLAAMLRSRYGVDACAIVPASRGFYGETWQVRAGGERYFLKVDALPFHQARFRCGLAAVDYFCSRGIAFAGRVIPAKDGAL